MPKTTVTTDSRPITEVQPMLSGTVYRALHTIAVDHLLHLVDSYESSNIPTFGLIQMSNGIEYVGESFLTDSPLNPGDPNHETLLDGMRTGFKSASIGARCWAKILENHWNLIHTDVGAISRTCIELSTSEYFKHLNFCLKRLGEIHGLSNYADLEPIVDDLAEEFLVVANLVSSGNTYQQASIHWTRIADKLDQMAIVFPDFVQYP